MELLYLDDIVIPSYLHGPGERVERSEMLSFARTWDPLPIHIDEEAAREFGGITASGSFLLAFRIRLIHKLAQQPAVIASFGYDEVRFKAPVFAGDELALRLEFVDCRPSTSKSDRGIVTIRQVLTNQDGKEVMFVRDTVLVRKKGK